MSNKVAASFGVVMAAFIVLAIAVLGFSALKHARHNTASHNQQHHAQVDAWIARMRRKTWRNTRVDRDVEMQAPPPELPRRPESARVRFGPSRVSRMGRLNFAHTNQRIQFCDVPLTPIHQGQRGVTTAGFF
ncbi:hypothetical protein KCU71_g10115, partial [Aureobasidium melanogenum]